MKSLTEISLDGVWHNNPALVQLLGLCPLLAVTSSVVNALGLGLATLLVLVGSNCAVSLLRDYVPAAVRLPTFVIIIASFVTCAELLMQAFTYELYTILGIFIPLIVTNCSILGRADAFASKHPLVPSFVDGFMMGLGFLLVLLILGAMRELLGQGTLFDNMQLLFGAGAADWKWVLIEDYSFLFMILPPGAFFGMGILIALKNLVDTEVKRRQAPVQAPIADRRVRVTG